MNVDFSSLGTYAIALITPVALALAYVLGTLLLKWLSTNKIFGFLIPETVVRSYLQEAIQWGIGYATQKVNESNLQVKFDNPFIAQVVQYVVERVPDALDRFGISPSSLEAMVKARLGLTDPTSVSKIGSAVVKPTVVIHQAQ